VQSFGVFVRFLVDVTGRRCRGCVVRLSDGATALWAQNRQPWLALGLTAGDPTYTYYYPVYDDWAITAYVCTTSSC